MKKFLVIFLILFSASCKGNWSYEGKTGPKKWGDLDEKYKFCKIGYNQSPIDVQYDFREDEDLKFFYAMSDVEKQRKDYVMQYIFDDRTFVRRGKKPYYLRSFSFNHPSEHLINGKANALEMQITHKSDDEQFLKIAVLFKVGKENPRFKNLIKLMTSKEKTGAIDLSEVIKTDDYTFFYDGSMTTPPCLEGVKWYVMKTPIEISKEQMNQVIKAGIFVTSNSRPVQAFHPEKY